MAMGITGKVIFYFFNFGVYIRCVEKAEVGSWVGGFILILNWAGMGWAGVKWVWQE